MPCMLRAINKPKAGSTFCSSIQCPIAATNSKYQYKPTEIGLFHQKLIIYCFTCIQPLKYWFNRKTVGNTRLIYEPTSEHIHMDKDKNPKGDVVCTGTKYESHEENHACSSMLPLNNKTCFIPSFICWLKAAWELKTHLFFRFCAICEE